MPHRHPIIGGNWKMNTTRASAAALAAAVADGVRTAAAAPEVVVFPPFPYLLEVGAVLTQHGGRVALGAQDVYHAPGSGAFTGEVSTDMLRDCGVTHVLAGHSERRHILGESDELVGKKARAILAAGLACVLCVGETLEQRKAGQTDAVNERQLRAGLDGVPAADLARVVIAYEPVWAIGTGLTPTVADVAEMHGFIRQSLVDRFGAAGRAMRLLYGGSVKPGNARELLGVAEVDGALVGGASLVAEDFLAIARSYIE